MVSTRSRSTRSTASSKKPSEEKKPTRKKRTSPARNSSAAEKKSPLTAAEQKKLRTVLIERRDTLQEEYSHARAELHDLQSGPGSDTGGEDNVDNGTQTLEREQEFAIAHGMLERIEQVEHALRRLDTGTYGTCERCGKQIPLARLEAFPAATLCVSCKQLEERR